MTDPMQPACGNAVAEVMLQKTLGGRLRSSKSSVASFRSQSEDLIGNLISPGTSALGSHLTPAISAKRLLAINAEGV
jgi:hypothetical protein